MTVRVTRKTARLLRTLLVIDKLRKLSKETGAAAYHMPSREIMKRAGVSSGSFYPIMARLESHSWVETEWEVVPEGQHRPRRLFYYLTEPGVIAARSAMKENDNRITLWDRIMKGLAK